MVQTTIEKDYHNPMLGYKRQTVYGIVGALFLTMLVSIVDARPQPHTNHCPDTAAYLELLEEPAEKLLPVIRINVQNNLWLKSQSSIPCR